MGIDRHELQFIRYALKKQPLGHVATMGRQGLCMTPHDLRKLLGTDDAAFAEYCEPLLTHNLGAKSVESFDYSDFEGATHLIDLNKPVDPKQQYDTVIDAGTLEHIFNAPEALRTFNKLCRLGGQILHMSPSNQLCNHGFWQLSPELFFSLYNEANGFADTEVFLADVGERDFWYQLTPPKSGHWGDATSPRAMYCLARTRKVRDVPEFVVQQSGYVDSWDAPPPSPAPWNSARQRIKRALEGTPAFSALRFVNHVVKRPDHSLRLNPDFVKRPLADLVS